MNHAAPQFCPRLEPAFQNQLTPISVFNQRRVLVDNAISVCEVPMKIAMDSGVIEVCERVRELSKLLTKILQQSGRVWLDFSKRHTRKICDKAHEMPLKFSDVTNHTLTKRHAL